jgi:hypothetical protein
MRRFSLTAVVAAAAALIAAPTGASGATTIGQTFSDFDANGCQIGFTNLQAISPGGQYAAPSAGVITSWSYEAPASSVPQLKLKVARPAGGDDFTVIGESSPMSPAASSLNSFSAKISVQAGDVIGLYTVTAGSCFRASPGYFVEYLPGDLAPPTTETFISTSPDNQQLDVSAVLEPDCDRDGLGDETQDTDISSCAPSPATGQRAAAIKRCKKKFQGKAKAKKRKKCIKKAKKLPV